MLKSLYILSENSWTLKSYEIFADLFYTLTLLFVYGIYVLALPNFAWITSVQAIVLLIGYYFFLMRYNEKTYLFSLLAQLLILFLLLPLPFHQQILFPLSLATGMFVHFLLLSKYRVRMYLSLLVLTFAFLWDYLFTYLAVPLRQMEAPSSLDLFLLGEIKSDTLGNFYSLPLLAGEGFKLDQFRAPAEYLSVYLLVSVSWFAFRRSILATFFVAWLVTFFVFSSFGASLPIPLVVTYASLGFFLQLIPGRNFYGSFYASLLTFVIILPISFVVGKWIPYPILIYLFFFFIESLLNRVFLGK
ncbi:hypothetical protein [Leptospira ryugenii]|uniref:hypothetical protein n=1 Tax=Leptospira ryugenii TaxID=1917863 RepID=UPI000D5A135D|nr:hypothetical protein [Leptospira ryugenii]